MRKILRSKDAQCNTSETPFNCELSPSSLIALMQKLSSVLTLAFVLMSKTVKESKRHRTKPKEQSRGYDKLSQGTIAPGQPNRSLDRALYGSRSNLFVNI